MRFTYWHVGFFVMIGLIAGTLMGIVFHIELTAVFAVIGAAAGAVSGFGFSGLTHYKDSKI